MPNKKTPKNLTKTYPLKDFIAKIRRLADDLEAGQQFPIQIAGEKIRVPKHAIVNIEHERDESNEELEFQITWRTDEE